MMSGDGWNRTNYLMLTRHQLYQMSYAPTRHLYGVRE